MIGTMKHRITFKRPVKTKDGRGSWTESESEILTTWGTIASLNALEVQKYMSILPQIDRKIFIRYRDDIDSTCVGYFGSKKYEILGVVNPTEGNKLLKLLVKEVLVK